MPRYDKWDVIAQSDDNVYGADSFGLKARNPSYHLLEYAIVRSEGSLRFHEIGPTVNSKLTFQ
jgi:hypothetical protein